ncbi:MAG: hypothetical protein ACRDVP_09865 [Acidimicrobiales bacterium]
MKRAQHLLLQGVPPRDERHGVAAGTNELETDVFQQLQGPAGVITWKRRSGSITSSSARSRAMIASMVAASTQRATWPRTRRSLQW